MITYLMNKLLGNTSKLDSYFNRLEDKMDTLLDRCDTIEHKLDNDIIQLSNELDLYKAMLFTISDTIPDMLWCKDLNGKYMYVNLAIKQGLLFDNNPIGQTDIEMAKKAKQRFGEYNHTFGEKCSNSDLIVIEKVLDGTFKKEDGRFLESGMIKGKMVYLEVFKAPMFVQGKLIGVVGTGRDMTEYIEAYRKEGCDDCEHMFDIFKKYEFGEE